MLPYYLSLTRNRSLNYLDHLKVRARHEENESYKNLLYAETDYSEPVSYTHLVIGQPWKS